MEEKKNDRKKYCFIVTVGTSMISDDHHFTRTINQNKDDESYEAALNSDIKNYQPHCVPGTAENISIGNAYNNINNGSSDFSRYGAELSALYSKAPKPQKCDCVTLIATRTHQGDFCSEVLKCILGHSELKLDCEIIRPKYLGLAEDPVFITKGLPEFLNSCYDEIRRKKEQGYEVILCPNGGYKALIPYMTLAGLLEGLEIRYVYESSNEAMALPQLPIGPDMAAFDEHLQKLEDIEYENDDSLRKSIIADLPEKLKPLFDEKTSKLSDLGKFLWNAYRQASDLTPLGRATGNKGLLSYLTDDLRRKFRALTGLDYLIWKGDRVPEMVEHASRHHTNLFRIAQKILLPCYQNLGNKFLSPEELFTLLCALMLHDCGHVTGSVPWPAWKEDGKERLFPGEIREFHHILGFMRLREGCKPPSLDPIYTELANSDAWKGIAPDKIWEDYLKAPATAGLYHRKIMPLTSADKNFDDCKFFNNGNGVGPLENVSVKIGSTQIDSPKMLLIVSLLRLIDSLDNQSSRAGGLSYFKFHMNVLESEINELSTRIHDFKNSCALDNTEQQKIECALMNSHVVNNKKLTDREKLKELIKNKQPKDCYLIRSFFELLLMKRFKELQKEHYDKHLPVERIKITPYFNDTPKQMNITIDVVVNEAICNRDEKKKVSINEFRKGCLEELRQEYTKIDGILNGNNIYIHYGNAKQ